MESKNVLKYTIVTTVMSFAGAEIVHSFHRRSDPLLGLAAIRASAPAR